MSGDDVIHMLATVDSSDDEDIIFDDEEEDDPDAELRPEPSLIYIQQPNQEKPEVIGMPEVFSSPVSMEDSPMFRGSRETSNADDTVSFHNRAGRENDEEYLPVASGNISIGAATESTAPSSTKESTADHFPQQAAQQPAVSFKEPYDSPKPSKSKRLEDPLSPPGIAPAMSDMTSQPPDSPKSHSVMTIEHSVARTPRSAAFLFGMSKPVFAAVSAMMLLTSGSAAFFLSQYIRIPGLDNQIDALENEVTRLEEQLGFLQEEIDRLTVEVDRLEIVVDDLAIENDRLEEQNIILAAANEEFADLNQQLNSSNAVLEMQVQNFANTTETLTSEVDRLGEENEMLANSAEALEMEIDNLGAQVNNLTDANTNLTALNDELVVQVDELSSNVTQLEGVNDDLQQANQNLTNEVDRLVDANADLEDQVNDLTSILQFLNGTIGSINDTFAEAVEVLTGLLQGNQVVLLANMQTSYGATVDGWKCDFVSDFAGEAFIEDPNSPIGEIDYTGVIGNVERNVLGPLCLETTDFEDYVNTAFLSKPPGPPPPNTVTWNQLNSAVERYTTFAIDYYFPDEGEDGLTTENWADAGYRCEGLPADLRFGTIQFTFDGLVFTPVFP